MELLNFSINSINSINKFNELARQRQGNSILSELWMIASTVIYID